MGEGGCGSYDVIREGDEVILRIECEACTFFPSIEDSPRTMAMAIDLLAEVGPDSLIPLNPASR